MMMSPATFRVGDVVLLSRQALSAENGIHIVERAATKQRPPKLRRYNPLAEAASLCRELGWSHYAERLLDHNEIDRVWGIAVTEFDGYFHKFGGFYRLPGHRHKRRTLARLLGELRKARQEKHECRHVVMENMALNVN